MHLPTKTQLIYGKTARPPVALAFTVADVARRQTRFRDRVTFAPEINLKDYRFSALVDFIEFRVVFARRTNAQSVQKILREFLSRDSHIVATDIGAGSAASVFDIRIQEPKSFALVAGIYAALKGRFGESIEPLISKVEFSVDAYPRVPSDEARARLFAIMQRTIFPKFDFLSDARDRPRSSIGRSVQGSSDTNNRKLLPYGQQGKTDVHLWHRHEDHHAPWLDGTMYIGAEDAEVMIRLQDKETDQRNKAANTFLTLRERQKRVRIEVTLQGQALIDNGIFELSALRDFSFARLQGKFFQFMLPTFPKYKITPGSWLGAVTNCLEGYRARGFLKSGMLGLDFMDAQRKISIDQIQSDMRRTVGRRGVMIRGERNGTGQNRDYVAYAELSRCVATALRHLEQREANAWGR